MSDEISPIRILVVDDHPVVRAGIESLMTGHADMIIVAQAANGREAIQHFRTHRPHVTLMDIQMPEMNGLDALMAIRNESPEARIIMLTTYAGDAQVMRAIKAGAQGYLLKNALHRELLDTIRAVHAGKKALSADVSYEVAEHATDDALTPADVAFQRQFRVTEQLNLRFRAEFFNIFNHPNFGPPDGNLPDALFGYSTQTLASSLGSGGALGGFNPLYQIGGPRSIQLALKLAF